MEPPSPFDLGEEINKDLSGVREHHAKHYSRSLGMGTGEGKGNSSVSCLLAGPGSAQPSSI